MLFLAVIFVIGVFAQQTFADEPEAVVGGTTAEPGEFPWQVSLQQYKQHFCGGSIIAPTKILTAAHCVKDSCDLDPSLCKVITGTINVNQGETHIIKSIRIHPKYKDSQSASWENDVAVITLTKPIQYNAQQRPIALADSPPVSGTTCVLSGWGMTRANGPLPTILLKVYQYLLSLYECKRYYPSANLTESHLCALKRQGEGSCQGDSGGPLVCNGKQYGITSWNVPCARGLPDAYTSVYHHRSFILSS